MTDSAAQDYSVLFQPGNIGRLHLKNRLIMAPMGNSLADEEGRVTDGLLAYYKERAVGGVGCVTTQFFSVNREDMMPYSLGLYDDSFLPGLRSIVDTVHEQDAKATVQLMHPGLLLILLPSLPDGMTIKVPSITPIMPAGKPYTVIEPEDVERYAGCFGEAAARAVEAGADAVEIHACHGCLLSSFLSPVTNRREDEYGGSVEYRARFTRMVITGIRNRIGREFPLIVRINGTDDFEGGVTPEDVVRQSQLLQDAGADAISISAGLEYWATVMAPPYSAPEGVNADISARVKAAVSVPVITAGKLTPEKAADVIAGGQADFIALGRPLLADPELPGKLAGGRAEDVRRCLYCNNCLRMSWRSCTVNPYLFRERDKPSGTASDPARVMIIGGGIAGMEAAVLLAERGHSVSLYEQREELGGQWRIAAALPEKVCYRPFINYLERRLQQLGVTMHTEQKVSKDIVLEEGPDAVVVATGAVPRTLDIPGLDRGNVVQANDVITGAAAVRDPVVIVGANMLGMELAASLATEGRKVTLVSHGRLGGRRGPDDTIAFRALMRTLIEQRVPVFSGVRLLEVTPHHLVIEIEKEPVALPAETIAVAIGVESVYELADELAGVVSRLHTIGDCVVPGNAAQATFSAARLIAEIEQDGS